MREESEIEFTSRGKFNIPVHGMYVFPSRACYSNFEDRVIQSQPTRRGARPSVRFPHGRTRRRAATNDRATIRQIAITLRLAHEHIRQKSKKERRKGRKKVCRRSLFFHGQTEKGIAIGGIKNG